MICAIDNMAETADPVMAENVKEAVEVVVETLNETLNATTKPVRREQFCFWAAAPTGDKVL